MPRRRGQPSKLNQVVDRRADGTDITASEALVTRLQAGAYREEAARSVGISKQTLYNWLHAGSNAKRAIATGQKITAEQQQLADFLDAVDQAEAQAQLTDWTRLGAMAVGGIPVTTTTVELKLAPNGDVVERKETTKTERTLPNVAALTWRLERRWPNRYGRRIEVTGADGGPIEVDVNETQERASELVAAVRAFREQVAGDVAIEATAREVER